METVSKNEVTPEQRLELIGRKIEGVYFASLAFEATDRVTLTVDQLQFVYRTAIGGNADG